MNERLKLLSSVLRAYSNAGKSLTQFEEENGCKIIYTDQSFIVDVSFNPKSNETLFMLKHKR